LGAYPEIGYEIKVQMVKDPEQKLYSSTLCAIEEDAFVIELILKPEEQFSLPVDETIVAYFNVTNQYFERSLYEFTATILSFHEGFSKITRPAEQEVIRFQRRNYLRFPCDIEATFKIVSRKDNNGTKINKATIVNLSASGADLESRKEVFLKDSIELYFKYAKDSTNSVSITVTGEVVRVNFSDIASSFAIKFTDISENDRRIIMDGADDYFRRLKKRLVFIA